MANVEKLEAVLDYIRLHPDNLYQGSWASSWSSILTCGTTLCAAGTAVMLAGYEIEWGTYIDSGVTIGSATHCRIPGYHVPVDISFAAQELLELTDGQAYALFYEAESLDDVKLAIKDTINDQAGAVTV